MPKFGGKLTLKAGYTRSEQNTGTFSRTWSIEQPVTVPANKTYKAVVSVSRRPYSTPWTADVPLDGNRQGVGLQH